MPVGKLLTRLTNDVDALSEVFGSGAVGVIADFVSLIVISLTMLSIDKGLAILLLLTQVQLQGTVGLLRESYAHDCLKRLPRVREAGPGRRKRTPGHG